MVRPVRPVGSGNRTASRRRGGRADRPDRAARVHRPVDRARAVARGPVRVGRVLGGPGTRAARGPLSRHGAPGPPLEAQDLRLLAELLQAGVPMLGALETLARNARGGRTVARLRAAADAFAGGADAASVLATGSSHVSALLRTGERVGRLAESIATVADLEERLAAVRRRVLSALAYPLVVLVIASAVVALVMTTAVPQMAATFDDLGGDLPRLTRLAIRLVEVVASPGAVATVSGGGMVLLLLRRRGRSAGPARGSGASGHRLPGRLGRDLESVVAVRIIATMLTHGVPLVAALDAAAASATDRRVRAAFLGAAARVRAGGRLVDAQELGALLSDADVVVLGIGEERGILAQQFARVAERRLATLERRLELVGVLAEPLLVLVVGLLVGGVVAALYLPSFRVLELL